MTMPTKVRAMLRAKLEAQIAWENEQVKFFAALGDIANEQYYMGRMHALLNLKWDL